MNKKEISELLKIIDLREYNQENGNNWQKEHALIIESFLNDLSDNLIVQALYGLQDLQVRDYAMGLLDKNNQDHKKALEKLIKYSSVKYSKPAKTLLALWYFENKNTEQAKSLISKIKNYSLAELLTRTFNSGWPVETFEKMRVELHPKVKENIFQSEKVA